MFSGLPLDQAEQVTTGAQAGAAISLPIRAGEALLAVVKFKDGGRACVGLDPAKFTVSNNAIQSATENTDGWKLAIVWTSQNVQAA